MAKAKSLSVTLTKSLAKRLPKHLANAHGLGLKRIHQTVHLQDTPAIRGMINQIYFMVKVEETK
ncbi:50S ribosomal protein L30 [Candidatus Berkiella aquae]|uniref:Large ribosomal subunit protein uL30 n=1 Tax=Candidatus Berkiella aquae TaxID=295108 RepID=A0A0Q9YKZ9_9GAMM|nr:50S ribosomal protein L30 [Candidatus Berkiella aquae]MCS5710282.1 50S ribosomal protein L30 [Candidatus Berkiella aquae]